MAIFNAMGSVCDLTKSFARRMLLAGLGVTAVVVENVLEAAENAGPYTEKLVERGQQASEEINLAFDQRRQEIRERGRENGKVEAEQS